MKKIGIICEYNPFHNGHLYHIEKIKERFPNCAIVLVLSGYFTERGDVSLISKYNKTAIALRYGIALVLEFPTLYAVQSADYFAERAIAILNEVGVSTIVFGSEIDDVTILKDVASKQLTERDFDKSVRKELATGVNYPTALSRACGISLKSNDILGLAYVKAILKNGYSIECVTIKRTNDFNDVISQQSIVSAQNIRKRIELGESIEKYIPLYNRKWINIIDEKKLYELLKYRITTSNNLSIYLGVDEGLSFKMIKEIKYAISLDEFIKRIKSKRYTYVRLKRMLIHILLGIKKEDANIESDFIRVLGFTSSGRKILKECDNKNLVYRYSNRVRDIELRAKEIYMMLTNDESSKIEENNRPLMNDDEF